MHSIDLKKKCYIDVNRQWLYILSYEITYIYYIEVPVMYKDFLVNNTNNNNK